MNSEKAMLALGRQCLLFFYAIFYLIMFYVIYNQHAQRNLYKLILSGYANVVQFAGIRIGGLSGIYKAKDYVKGWLTFQNLSQIELFAVNA